MDLQAPISRAEHNEFAKRIDEQEARQDARIRILESDVEILKDMNSSIKQLANSMQGMLEEQQSQGQRLAHLESRDGEKWRELVKYVASALAGGLIAYGLRKLGIY